MRDATAAGASIAYWCRVAAVGNVSATGDARTALAKGALGRLPEPRTFGVRCAGLLASPTELGDAEWRGGIALSGRRARLCNALATAADQPFIAPRDVGEVDRGTLGFVVAAQVRVWLRAPGDQQDNSNRDAHGGGFDLLPQGLRPYCRR